MEPNNVITDPTDVTPDPTDVTTAVTAEPSNVTPGPTDVMPDPKGKITNLSRERNKIFNLGIVRNSIRRFWPLWLAYGIVLALLVVAPTYSAMNELMSMHFYDAHMIRSTLNQLWRIGAAGAVSITFVASLISAIVHNDHLFSRSAATFVGSLPMRRSGIYVTFFVAGLLPLVIIPTLAALVMLPLCVSSGGTLPASHVGLWLVLMMALSFIFYAMAQLACHLAGSRPVAVLLYFVINFLAPCLQAAGNAIFSLLIYGLSSANLHLEWAAPFVGLMMHGILADYFSSLYGVTVLLVQWDVICIYCIVALIVTVLVWLLFGRRRLEAAGESIAFVQARPPLKYLAGISLALLFGLAYRLFYSGGIIDDHILNAGETVALAIALFLGAFFGVYFAEMIIQRSARVLKSSWRGALILAGLCVALVVGSYFDVVGFQRRVPKAEDVESVTVQLEWSHGATLTSPEAIEAACELHHDIASWRDQGNRDAPYFDVLFVYHLANGSDLERHYVVHADYYNEDALALDEADEHAVELVQRTMDLLDAREARETRHDDLLSQDPRSLTFYLEYPYYVDVDPEEDDALEDEELYEQYEEDGATIMHQEYYECAYYDEFYLDASEREELLSGVLQHDLLEEQAGSFAYELGYISSPSALDAELYVENKKGEVLLSITLDPTVAPQTTAWFIEHHPELLEHQLDTD